MRVLIAGGWEYPMYERAIADALATLGHDVLRFAWSEHLSSAMGRMELKFSIMGPRTHQLNADLIHVVKEARPTTVLVWRGTNVFPATLVQLKSYGVAHVASYNHDDFTGPGVGAPVPWHHARLWKRFLQCAPCYDSHFVKRVSNIEHLRSLGAKHAFLMPMWFVPLIHRPVELTPDELTRNVADVVFVGHYEPDGREENIRALISAGFQVKVRGGPEWHRSIRPELYERLAPITPADGEEYAKALCAAKICLCFLSKLNRDAYTRRCFEIPACGRVMLAERTDELLRLFKEDEEACFFSTREELLCKVDWLLRNPTTRHRIAEAGLRRVWADGHDVLSRARYFVQTVESWMASRA